MYILARLNGKTVTYKGKTLEEMKDLKDGTLVHYTESDVGGLVIPDVTKIVKDEDGDKMFKAIYLSMDEIREWREVELKESDWRATIDYPGSDQQDWLDYRSELRGLPQKYGKVESIVMPIKP